LGDGTSFFSLSSWWMVDETRRSFGCSYPLYV